MNPDRTSNKTLKLTIIGLVIAILGLVGYIIWQNIDRQGESQSFDQAQANSAGTSETDKVVEWAKVENDYYTLPIPDGWKVWTLVDEDTQEPTGNVMTQDEPFIEDSHIARLTYEAGTPAVIENHEPPRRGVNSNFNVYYDDDSSLTPISEMNPANRYPVSFTERDSLTTKDGVKISKFHARYDESYGAVDISLPAGTDEYIYEVTRQDGTTVRITYVIFPDQANNLEQLEMALQQMEIHN